MKIRVLEIDFKHPSALNNPNCITKKNNISVEDHEKAVKANEAVNRECIDSINSCNYSTDESFGTELEPVETRQKLMITRL